MTNLEVCASQTKRLSTVDEDVTKSEVNSNEVPPKSDVNASQIKTEHLERNSKNLDNVITELEGNEKRSEETSITSQPKCDFGWQNDLSQSTPESDHNKSFLKKCFPCCSRSCWSEVGEFITACFTCDDEFYQIFCCCKRGYQVHDTYDNNIFYANSSDGTKDNPDSDTENNVTVIQPQYKNTVNDQNINDDTNNKCHGLVMKETHHDNSVKNQPHNDHVTNPSDNAHVMNQSKHDSYVNECHVSGSHGGNGGHNAGWDGGDSGINGGDSGFSGGDGGCGGGDSGCGGDAD